MASSLTVELEDDRPWALPIGWTLDKLACWWLTVAVVFVMGADFRGDTGGDFSVHWQIYLRLLLAFVCGVVGALLLFPKTYRDFFAGPGLLMTAYLSWYAITLPMSINKSYSVAAWVSLLGVALFVPGAMKMLGGFRFLTAIATGLTMYLVGSWIAYIFFPQIGVFHEQVTQTEVFDRMGGLGHPNDTGFYAVYAVLVLASLGLSGRVNPWMIGIGILLAIATLVQCYSRTAIVVCCLGLLVTFREHLRFRGNVFAIVAALALVMATAFVTLGTGKLDWAIESALKKVTKSGSTDELTSATGRTEIWAYAIEQIAESPLYGYGYCSARFVMEEHSFHCHNVVLNAAMFGGFIAGATVFGIILYLIYGIFFIPRPEIDGLAACIVAGGMVEGLLGAASPAASVVIWITILFWRQLGMDRDHSP